MKDNRVRLARLRLRQHGVHRRSRHQAAAHNQLKRDLLGLLGELVEPLTLQREHQARTFERHRGTLLTGQQADHAIMGMYRAAVMGVQRIADVLREWNEPSSDDFRDTRSAWRMFNAATFALTGRGRPFASVRL